MIDELQHLINNLPQSKIDAHTHDLHFDWSDLTKLSPGQTSVLLKRMRQASRKTQEDFKRDARDSDLIKDMKRALRRLQKGLRDGNSP